MFKVLIVDDDPFIPEGLAHMVDWAAMDMCVAAKLSNGLEAQRYIEANPVDVLLTDICMPEMDGLSLIEWIRRSRLPIRCIVLSGYDETKYLHRALKLGIDNYLVKAIDENELIETLQSIADELERAHTDPKTSSADILRCNILERWVHGRIVVSELQERMEMVGIRKNARQFRVTILRFLGDLPLTVETRMRFAESAQRTLDAMHAAFLQSFMDADDDLVIIEATDPQFTPSDPRLLKEALEPVLGGAWFCASGTCETGYERTQNSYRSAKNLLGYALICPQAGTVSAEELPADKPASAEADLSALRDAIARGDKAQAVAFAERVFSHEYDVRDVPADFFSNFAYRVWTMILELDPNSNQLLRFKPETQVYDELRDMRSRDALRRWVSDVLESHWNQIDDSRSEINPLVRRALDYVRTNYADDLSLKTLAVKFRCNSAHLGRIFKEQIGESFSVHLNRVRIEIACRMLREGDQSVSAIARAIGYTNTNYFLNVFHRFMNCTPGRYRTDHVKL